MTATCDSTDRPATSLPSERARHFLRRTLGQSLPGTDYDAARVLLSELLGHVASLERRLAVPVALPASAVDATSGRDWGADDPCGASVPGGDEPGVYRGRRVDDAGRTFARLADLGAIEDAALGSILGHDDEDDDDRRCEMTGLPVGECDCRPADLRVVWDDRPARVLATRPMPA
jgi:hypothetical protein